MELTSAKLANANPEPENEVEPDQQPLSEFNKGMLYIFAFVVLTVSGYVLFLSGLFSTDDGAGKSASLKQVEELLGMGPKAGAMRFVAPAVGAVIVAILALSVLSRGGRDVQMAKEQSERSKRERREKQEKEEEKSKAEPEPAVEEECNLASYKLFKSMSEAAANTEAAPKPTA